MPQFPSDSVLLQFDNKFADGECKGDGNAGYVFEFAGARGRTLTPTELSPREFRLILRFFPRSLSRCLPDDESVAEALFRCDRLFQRLRFLLRCESAHTNTMMSFAAHDRLDDVSLIAFALQCFEHS